MTPGRLIHEKSQKFNVLYRSGVWYMRKLKNLMFYDARASRTMRNLMFYDAQASRTEKTQKFNVL